MALPDQPFVKTPLKTVAETAGSPETSIKSTRKEQDERGGKREKPFTYS